MAVKWCCNTTEFIIAMEQWRKLHRERLILTKALIIASLGISQHTWSPASTSIPWYTLLLPVAEVDTDLHKTNLTLTGFCNFN
jgi:hypothetical protein